jgi:hypothetical protein
MTRVAIALGPDSERRQVRSHARGVIAIGDIATGVVAIGGLAAGGLAVGGVAVGGLAAGYYALGGEWLSRFFCWIRY